MRPQVLCNLALGLLAASTACNAFRMLNAYVQISTHADSKLTASTLNFPDPRDETLLPRADLTGDGGKTGGLLVTSQRAAVANISTCAGGQCVSRVRHHVLLKCSLYLR